MIIIVIFKKKIKYSKMKLCKFSKKERIQKILMIWFEIIFLKVNTKYKIIYTFNKIRN